jgi:hypothetical protein
MPLDVESRAIRKLDLASFTGDTWAVKATLEVPGATVPRFIATGGPIDWVVYGMTTGKADAVIEIDTTTSISTTLVTISRVPDGGAALLTPMVATSGTILSEPIIEDDISTGDVFMLAVPSIVVGTAPWIWIVPTAGCRVLPEGVSP